MMSEQAIKQTVKEITDISEIVFYPDATNFGDEFRTFLSYWELKRKGVLA